MQSLQNSLLCIESIVQDSYDMLRVPKPFQRLTDLFHRPIGKKLHIVLGFLSMRCRHKVSEIHPCFGEEVQK